MKKTLLILLLVILIFPVTASTQSTSDLSAALRAPTTTQAVSDIWTMSATTISSTTLIDCKPGDIFSIRTGLRCNTTPVTPSSAAPVAVSNSGCVNLTTNLRQFDTDATTGGEVTKLQGFLYSKGYLSVMPTGYFGTMTRDAVTIFQNKKGLVPNPPAFVGPQTRAAIAADSCGTASATPVTSSSAPIDCKPGDVFSIRTGLRCVPLNTTGTFTNTSSSTATTSRPTATTTPITNAPPTVLPYMRILTIAPLTTVASTTRDVYMTWEAESMTTLDIALMNDTTNNVMVVASSTPNDGNQLVRLSSATIPDGTYSMMIYWPINRLAYAKSPLGTVSVSSKLITVNKYPSGSSTTTPSTNYASNEAAYAEYQATVQETQKEVEEAKKKVQNASTPAEKQSALQSLCEGWKFWINPGDCALITLTGV
jgi:hypothetical protein